MPKLPFLFAFALCAALAPFNARAADATELRIGFVPGPYADEFKVGVEPQLRQKNKTARSTQDIVAAYKSPVFQQVILNNRFYDGFRLPEYFAMHAPDIN